MSLDAMKQALEALELYQSKSSVQMFDDAAKALRAAIEQAQEPVAWYDSKSGWTEFHLFKPVRKPSAPDSEWLPLYTTPPRQWQRLTADEIWKCNAAPSGSAVEYHICMAHQNVLDFAEAIEAKLKEKNT